MSDAGSAAEGEGVSARDEWRRRDLHTTAAAMLPPATAAENGETISEEEEERLHLELEQNYLAAVRVFETRFADLPPISKLRQLWQEKKIAEDDPVWLMVEVMSLHDARSQLILAQVMKILKAADALIQYSVGRVEITATRLKEVNGELKAMYGEVVETRSSSDVLSKQMETFARLMPGLLGEMKTAHDEISTARWTAKLQLMGLGALMALGGLLVGYLVFGHR